MSISVAKSKALVPHDSKAVKALIEAGIIPEMCTRFELTIEVDRVVHATCEFMLSEEQMETIAAALRDNPEEAKAIARTFIGRCDRSATSGNDEQFVMVEDL